MHISIRELKSNPAHAIALTQQGQRVLITSRRKVVAELVAPQASAEQAAEISDAQAMQALLDTGIIAQAASKPLKLGKAVSFSANADGQTMSDRVIALRDSA